MKTIVVDKNGDGDFFTVAEALNSVQDGHECKIYIKNGIYEEKLVIDKPFITLEGENKEKTVLTYNDGALRNDETGNPMGTFKTASVHVTRNAEKFSAFNITFQNNAGRGEIAGQAVALYLDADKAAIKNCILKARQDTLLTAPMHEDIARDPEIVNRQYFEGCYIEGDVDFIFGGATVIFKECEIFSLNRDKEINGYITAACTAKELKFGYVFIDCRLTGNASENSVFLGRPWREFARTVFINCFMDKHIRKEGFSIWKGTNRHETCYYAQFNSTGDGFNKEELTSWSYLLNEDEAATYTIENIFDGWNPSL